MARLKISDKTIKCLYALYGNQCAFPSCEVQFVSADNKTNIANICHIEAAKPGGERFNQNSTDEEHRSFDNLIW